MFVRAFFVSILILLLYQLPPAQAQNSDLLQRDLSEVRADQVSDEQIRRFLQYAETQNLADPQIESGLLARGMSSAEAGKLLRRIRQLRATGGQQPAARASRATQSDTLRTRQSQRDTSLDAALSEEEKKIFGYELFNNNELTFEPSLNMATPQNYQVGPGDELMVNIWGASRQTYNLEVNRDGTVIVDNLGPIYVNGLSIEEASKRIKNRLTEIYAGLRSDRERPANTFAEITLGQVRSIKITIVGEVRKPGTYTLPSVATAFNALYLSGGPSVIGSFRDIEVVRNNQVVSRLDVYDFLVGGENTQNVVLRDQDIIRVVPYETRIELKGEVKRPGYYEMKKEEPLAEAIRFGGGFTDNAYTHRLKVTRKTAQAKRIEDVKVENLDSFMPRNGDVVQVDSILDRFENRVEIAGAVFRPGEYALTDSMTLMSLINRAEGLREDAFVKRVLVYREGEDLATKVLSADLRSIISRTVADIPLQREDVVRVLSVTDLEEEYKVEINGEVQNPGSFPFMYEMSLEDLIAMSGGLKESASKAKVEVARRIKGSPDTLGTEQEALETAEIFQFSIDEDLAIDPATARFTLEPFDEVFIRRSPGYEEQKTVYVTGEVKYPGLYAIKNKNERISDLIARAGGLTSYAYEEGANLLRLNPDYFEEKALREEALRDSLRMLQHQRYFSDPNSPQPVLTNTPNTTNRINTQAPSFREYLAIESASIPRYKIVEPLTQSIGIDLKRISAKPNSRYDIRLLPGDTLVIPKILQTVSMNGELLYPIASRYDDRKNFRDYVAEAGGFTREADRKRAYIIYANGSVDRTRSLLFLKNYPKVKPGAEIVIPRKPERQRISAQAWVGIGAGLATLTLTVITILDRLDARAANP